MIHRCFLSNLLVKVVYNHIKVGLICILFVFGSGRSDLGEYFFFIMVEISFWDDLLCVVWSKGKDNGGCAKSEEL